MKFPLGWLFFNRWLWITILACCVIAVAPFMVIGLLLVLPYPLKTVGVFGIIIGWSIAAGYKDYVQTNRREREFAKNSELAKLAG